MAKSMKVPEKGTLKELREFVESYGFRLEQGGAYVSEWTVKNFVGETVQSADNLEEAIRTCFAELGLDAPEVVPVLDDRRYAKNGGSVCPFCESGSIEVTDGIRADGNLAWQEVQCLACGMEWSDEFRLSGFSVIG